MILSNKLKTVLLKDIKPYKNNVKVHTEEQIDAIKKSIESNEYIQPIAIDRNNVIVIGHGRYYALLKIDPNMEIEVVDLKELSRDRIKKLRIQDNKLNESAWDLGNLENELKKIYVDIEGSIDKISNDLNFEPDFLKDMVLKSKYDDKSEDEIPEVKESRIKTGDLVELGDHRLLCGDCTVKENVDKVLDKKKVDMIFCDPPYGIDLDTDYSDMIGISRGKKYEKVKNDDKNYNPNHIFRDFKCKEIFLWGADYYAERVPNRNDGSWFVWDKTEGRIRTNSAYDKMFGSNFELCWSRTKHKRNLVRVLWKGFFGLGKDDTSKRVHPTQKPTLLCEWFINKFSKQDNIIVDLFLGSGSTLIASEKTGRICYGMEIDEHYCDVIIERYCQYTGNRSIKINNKSIEWNK